MIVVDTNLIAYALIEGPQTSLARQVRALDPNWVLPDLWQHEYLNVLATFALGGGASLPDVQQLWVRAREIFGGSVQPVDFPLALRLAVTHKVSAYDAQFIVLAQTLGVLCVTEDRRLLKIFPAETRSMANFCAENS